MLWPPTFLLFFLDQTIEERGVEFGEMEKGNENICEREVKHYRVAILPVFPEQKREKEIEKRKKKKREIVGKIGVSTIV